MHPALRSFLQQQQLPANYLTQASRCFDPLLPVITQRAQHQPPLMLALNGSQGSGKSTLAAYFQARLVSKGVQVVSLSLDDFYLGRAARRQLAASVHPLLATRGVPGTHDLPLMQYVLEQLTEGDTTLKLPCFDKASDDRLPESQWPICSVPPQVVIMEGWCWGARAVAQQSLGNACNALESEEDSDGTWRRFVNESLLHYEPLYAMMDAWMMLRALGFPCVYQWRREQEHKLIARLRAAGDPIPDTVMNDTAIARFIAHYQRLTEHLLSELPKLADIVWQLDETRHVTAISTRGMFASLNFDSKAAANSDSQTPSQPQDASQ